MPNINTAEHNLKQPKVIIIVLNWNGRQDTAECLESLKGLNYPNFEVIIVDNASKDGSQEYFRDAFPEAILVENSENLGFTGGFNVGIQKALQRGAVYVLCLNNDTILDSDFIKELVAVGERRDDAGGLCPKEYDYNYPNRLVYVGGRVGAIKSKLYGFGEIDRGQYDEEKETYMLCGAAMMLKTKALLNIGLFDPDYFYNTEDKDLAIRLMRGGYKLIYVPRAKLWHKRRGSTGGRITPLTAYFSARNSLLFVRKHGKRYEIATFLLYFFFVHIPFLLLRVSDKKECVKSIIMALKWHINPKSVPENAIIVESMTSKPKT